MTGAITSEFDQAVDSANQKLQELGKTSGQIKERFALAEKLARENRFGLAVLEELDRQPTWIPHEERFAQAVEIALQRFPER